VHVRIKVTPGDWLNTVGASLRYLCDSGAAISWAGGYECFGDYSPKVTFAGCYAAFTPSTGLVCLSDIDEDLRYIDEDPLLVRKLHEAVAFSSQAPP
ncbi:MAG: hypothetical protein ACRD7E_14075, partial [Bryobacteraceae bacterium]